MTVTKKKRNTWIPVVTGLIQRGEEVLIGLRPEDKNLPGVWEFPGGKIEPGESPEQALKRELLEELAIDVEVGPLQFASTHQYGEVGILLLFYQIKFWKGQPQAAHHTDIKWIHKNDLKDLDLPEANHKVLTQIIDALH